MTEDQVNNPPHYNFNHKGEKAIETYEYIESWCMNYTQGNIIKYVSRYPYKGKALEDLQKARWYINKLISQIEQEEKCEKP